MSRRSGQPWCHRLRIASMLVLAWCVLLQPALSALGQVHEAFEHTGATSQHHEAPEAHAGDDADHGDGPVHFLMHYVHCCASTTALVVQLPTLPEAIAALPPLPLPGPGRAQTRLGDPFRPPIQA